MKCSKCEVESPSNVLSFKPTVWTCPTCDTPKRTVIELLEADYKDVIGPNRILYVSEFSGTLFKVEQFFKENVLMDNPFCSITLTESPGIPLIRVKFDKIYADKNVAEEKELQPLLEVGGTLLWINPQTLTIL
jgi:hypothetical protein